MSQENAELVRRVYEVMAEGVDEKAFGRLIETGLVDPDAELDLSTAYPDGPVVRRENVTEFLDTQPWGRSGRFEAESFRAVGADRVLAFVRLRGRGTGSGVEVEGRLAHLIRIRGGRVVRTEVYTDRDEALQAAGLSE
jgi:ketosteroid isomerase-like protein